ncbi:Protein DJ-1 homolog B [Galdieria sulphuraria]|uniref:4-methyl-5(B-hydroxyethyl)-thiazole monophosphate biosynthesis n=1 Tax=Galdieria sulphuraria TaxID=130081 RepID=M2Y9B5_GALSU|nr:4-methyl-5(b-hydroxyethyl)-thiazole monophosphate biosynthesis [Galdieria sulphuraria]EME32683.1 4-methyl-5(b-hydroxyethyl)-thiazole monophosphate biosynthesis [Galdieria sulphuraria]GJD07886.1 Protein DJ-1 homolog B [Galdieria sulphuraria]|eukprot:XP_005709203.1 4-methyl-5(b-hydroxyethyl)-thiazole monophosphate biosynthesis [Galdieria sulphuraria]
MQSFVACSALYKTGKCSLHYRNISKLCVPFGFCKSFLPRSFSGRLSVGAPRSNTTHCKKTLVCTLRKVLVPIANGTEEIEAVTIADTLVRAGAQVTIASVENQLQITASRGVRIVADKLISDCTNEQYDLIAIPGGAKGAEKLGSCEELITLLRQQQQSGKFIGAICAAPALVLAENGFLEDSIRATCYPADQFLSKLKNPVDDEDCPVVVDGQFITSQGPGTALHFSLTLVEKLYGRQKAEELAALMLLTPEDGLFTGVGSDGNLQAVDVQEEAAL